MLMAAADAAPLSVRADGGSSFDVQLAIASATKSAAMTAEIRTNANDLFTRFLVSAPRVAAE
jgi:hypothetical protein